MGTNIIKDDTTIFRLSTELVITASGTGFTITESGVTVVGDYNGQNLLIVDTTDTYVYYKAKWYVL